MIIFYHIKNPNGLGADRWIYDGWRHAFEDLGHQVFSFANERDLAEKLSRLQSNRGSSIFKSGKVIKPDLIMTSYSLWSAEEILRLLALLETRFLTKPVAQDDGFYSRKKIALFIDNDFLKSEKNIQLARGGQLADVFFGERSEKAMVDFEKLTDQKYYLIANAADKKLHFPTTPVEKYKCDIVYLGAYLPKKKEAFKKILLPLAKKYNVKIFGPYWTWKDLFLLAGSKLSYRLRFSKLGDWFNKKRMLVASEDENKIYSSAKICVNFHEQQVVPDDLVNQRTFKIPACGGFEICDSVKSLRNFFTEEEVVTAENENDWFKKIDFYLNHEQERKKIQQKGTERALRDHTYQNRVEQLLKILRSAGFEQN